MNEMAELGARIGPTVLLPLGALPPAATSSITLQTRASHL
jgi:hypothetical protein